MDAKAAEQAARPPELQVDALEVRVENYEDMGPEPAWVLTFVAQYGPIRGEYTVCEPYLHSEAEWLGLLEGHGVELCQSNGEGDLVVRNGFVRFSASRHGGGDDYSSCFQFPVEALRGPLVAALGRVRERGLRYA